MPRLIVTLSLAQIRELHFAGIDVRPNPHAWVDDQSIRAALDAGLSDDTRQPHSEATNRAVRVATYVRMIDAGCLPRKAYAEAYWRGTALRLKFVDGNTRLRAMQFRRDPLPTKVHILSGADEIAPYLPAGSVVQPAVMHLALMER